MYVIRLGRYKRIHDPHTLTFRPIVSQCKRTFICLLTYHSRRICTCTNICIEGCLVLRHPHKHEDEKIYKIDIFCGKEKVFTAKHTASLEKFSSNCRVSKNPTNKRMKYIIWKLRTFERWKYRLDHKTCFRKTSYMGSIKSLIYNIFLC